MKLEGRRESTNVDDRRGMSAGKVDFLKRNFDVRKLLFGIPTSTLTMSSFHSAIK